MLLAESGKTFSAFPRKKHKTELFILQRTLMSNSWSFLGLSVHRINSQTNVQPTKLTARIKHKQRLIGTWQPKQKVSFRCREYKMLFSVEKVGPKI